MTVLRNKGVELYNADLSHLHTDQNVIDDIHDESEASGEATARAGQNLTTAISTTWSCGTSPARGGVPAVDSPLETTAWVATLD